MIFMICLLLAVIVTEAATELVVDSEIFSKVRALLLVKEGMDPNSLVYRIKLFLFKLINCGYCTSVWIAGAVALLTLDMYNLEHFNLLPDYIKWLGITLVLHRLSNWLHVIYEYVRRGRILTFDVTYRENSVVDETIIDIGEQDE